MINTRKEKVMLLYNIMQKRYENKDEYFIAWWNRCYGGCIDENTVGA